MYDLRWLQSVRKEIIKIRHYIADDLTNISAFINLMKDIQTVFTQIKDNPNAFSLLIDSIIEQLKDFSNQGLKLSL
jgi:hypothetical protein